jgi:hypothetical protein
MDELALIRNFGLEDVSPEVARERAHSALGRRISRRRALRRSIVVLVMVGAVAIVASAYAVARELVVGSPAPREVKQEFAELGRVRGELIPIPRQLPGTIAGKARVAATLESSVGPVYVFAAPTRTGATCGFTWIASERLPGGRPNMSGFGCHADADPRPLMAVRSETFVQGRNLRLLEGHASVRIRRLEARVGGHRVRIPLQEGWFVAELDAPPSEVVGFDTRGRVVARQKFDEPAADQAPYPVGPFQTVLEIRTRYTRRPIRVQVARASDGTTCESLVTPGGISSGCGGRLIGARQIGVSPMQIGRAPKGMLLLFGRVGREIALLNVRFEDGRVERLPLARSFSVYQVAREDYRPGRRPILLVGRNRAGSIVATQKLPWAPRR